jgi:Domain of unknown function (DUF4333)
MRIRFARVVALAALAAMAVGCTKILDKRGLEAQLATEVQQNGPALTVHCPDGVKAQSGATFQCTATGTDGSSFALTVTQTDAKGDVTWKFTSASGAPPASPSPTTPATASAST